VNGAFGFAAVNGYSPALRANGPCGLRLMAECDADEQRFVDQIEVALRSKTVKRVTVDRADLHSEPAAADRQKAPARITPVPEDAAVPAPDWRESEQAGCGRRGCNNHIYPAAKRVHADAGR
jgi:hypothetical protein